MERFHSASMHDCAQNVYIPRRSTYFVRREVNVPRTISIRRDDLLENETEPEVKKEKERKKNQHEKFGQKESEFDPTNINGPITL